MHDRQRISTTKRVESSGAAGARQREGRRHPGLHGQQLVRRLNDEIRRLVDGLGVEEDALELVCECRDPDCFARISVPRAEFEVAHDAPGRFLVAADHAGPAETVVGRGDGYAVVEDRPRDGEPA